jgi:hypothetical protein
MEADEEVALTLTYEGFAVKRDRSEIGESG